VYSEKDTVTHGAVEAVRCHRCYSTDHDPKHVHVFEDRKRLLKFDVENWSVMEGKLTAKARKALEALRQEGVI